MLVQKRSRTLVMKVNLGGQQPVSSPDLSLISRLTRLGRGRSCRTAHTFSTVALQLSGV